MSNIPDITDFLRRAVELGGSDLHLAAGAPPAARVNGALVPLADWIFVPALLTEIIEGTLSESQRASLQEEWELDYALQVDGVGRFRGNVHLVRGHLEAAYRFIPTEVPDLSSLGHHPVVQEMCQLHRGLVLVTGVTGSGKTTTLASMIRRISEIRSGIIITIEDPIEFVFEHRGCIVKQREVGSDTRAFPRALRQALRQDPDVIVVSELRDLETIRIALTAAETGHLVLATLHTLDAPQSVERLVDVFPSDQQQQVITQLAGVIEGVISQRLIPRADGHGRVLASEVMRANYAIRTCIRERKTEQLVGLMEIGYREGSRVIDQSIEDLLNAGLISREEAINHGRERTRFQQPTESQTKKPKSIWA